VFSGHIVAGEQHLAEFKAAGVRSAMVTGVTETSERRAILDAYARGDLDVLVNCGILTEGYDDPPTSCVILARRIGSLSLFLQICGRVLRTCRQTGKIDAIILDLHGSSHTHGPPDEEHRWELEGDAIGRRRKPKLLDVRFCAVCQVLLEDDAVVCPGCGHARALPEAPEVLGIKLVKYARKRKEGPDERAASLGRWLKDAESQGFKPGWAYNKFKAVYGGYPSDEVKSRVAAQTHLTDR
jgi:DNA repair protein RadD